MNSQRSFDFDVTRKLAFVTIVPDQNIHPQERFHYPTWLLIRDFINH